MKAHKRERNGVDKEGFLELVGLGVGLERVKWRHTGHRALGMWA